MCKKIKGCGRSVDKCIRNLIEVLQARGVRTLACCCGHNKYPMTIVILEGFGSETWATELMTDIKLPRKTRFYRRDKQGYYYIPEVIGK